MIGRQRIAGAVLALVLAFAAACAGVRARSESLRPMALAWPPIAAAAERGAEASQREHVAEVIAQIRAALDALDRDALRGVDWPAVRAAAAADINRRLQAGEIGPGVADSLTERIRLFDELLTKALER